MARLGKQDWIDEGLKVLMEVGYEGIKIDRLCKRLDISIGSFYHHFKNIDDYVESMIRDWEGRTQSKVNDILEQDLPPEERIDRLHDASFETAPKLEVTIRAWSFQSPFIERCLDKMDRKRVRMLTGLFAEMGFGQDLARRLAEIDYASYLGVQTYSMNRSRHSARKLFAACTEMMKEHRRRLQTADIA